MPGVRKTEGEEGEREKIKEFFQSLQVGFVRGHWDICPGCLQLCLSLHFLLEMGRELSRRGLFNTCILPWA